MNTVHTIVHGDSRSMTLVPDRSVHLAITSPPYWQLKDYGHANQIGYGDTYENYINNLNLVWSECHRALHPGCRLCVNIGDQFARSVYYGRYKVIPIRTEIIKFCETIGFDYMGAIIWQKVTTTNTTGGASVMGSFPYPRNGILKLDYEFILLFKKQGIAPKPTAEAKRLSAMTTGEWNTFFTGHWNFAGARQNGHLAMFPEELPARLIKMFAFVGDTVLDPFLGSGTTSLAARNLGRNSVGYEVNGEFIPVIEEKLQTNQPDLGGTEFAFATGPVHPNPAEAIATLPYIFRDPHKLDNKIDPKTLQFGSKIDKHSRQRETYQSVKEVLGPTLLVLDGDITVRLLGIKEKPAVKEKAVAFLKNMTQGQKVYMKFDRQKHDDQNRLLCYLYLKNKTFINGRLLKEGLADIDEAAEFAHKNRFMAIGNGADG